MWLSTIKKELLIIFIRKTKKKYSNALGIWFLIEMLNKIKNRNQQWLICFMIDLYKLRYFIISNR
jgi:hypothetical protein